MNKLSTLAAALLTLVACNASQYTKSGLDPKAFESEQDGLSTALVTIANDSGMEACITNYGGYVVSLMAPDGKGRLHNVVSGFKDLSGYYPQNNPGMRLHGGPDSWTDMTYEVLASTRSTLWLAMVSEDFGQSGDIQAFVTYTLTQDNRLDIQFEAFSYGGISFAPGNLCDESCFDQRALSSSTGIVLTTTSTEPVSGELTLGPEDTFKSRKTFSFSVAE